MIDNHHNVYVAKETDLVFKESILKRIIPTFLKISLLSVTTYILVITVNFENIFIPTSIIASLFIFIKDIIKAKVSHSLIIKEDSIQQGETIINIAKVVNFQINEQECIFEDENNLSRGIDLQYFNKSQRDNIRSTLKLLIMEYQYYPSVPSELYKSHPTKLAQ